MSEHDDGNRRDFLRGAATGTAVGAIGAMGVYSYLPFRRQHFPDRSAERQDIGQIKSLRIKNISETSWFDNNTLVNDIRGAGGLLVNQYELNWPPFAARNGKLAQSSYAEGIKPIKQWLPNDLDKAWEFQQEHATSPENAGGYSCLLDIELMDGERKKILLDAGWSYAWMDQRFQAEGIDRMLANREIDMLVISHEHFDHFWGLPSVFKYDPTIKLVVPEGFYEEGFQYIRDSGHRGELVVTKPGVNQIYPGVALYYFAIPIITRVYGEQSFYINVADQGLVSVTGCCHQGIIRFAETALREIQFDKLHGMYGGLHISPFEDWDPKYDDLVFAFKRYGFEKVGCNHCTGVVTARKFIDAGYPVVRGSAQHGSSSEVYLGNGDTIAFGVA
jgi:7,8-dihydropterin-6-yl-methyl-4-(beta-D-ribofuranosyl)aminobenzene 5'-phosphate synthase